jgi:predicted MFS family arabinose efflux permease
MIVTMFPEPREQARAIGVYAFVASAGGSVGLLAGGVLTQAITWHWIFFVNLPIGAVTAFGALRLLEPDRGAGLRRGADVPGAVLITGALMLLVYTIVEPAAESGWGAPRTLALGAASLGLLAAFVAREATAATPLMPLRIFRSRNVAGANAVQALAVAGMFAVFFLGALYLQRVLGYDALQTGLAFLPTTLIMGALSLRVSAGLIGRIGARATLLPGLGCILAALLLFTRAPVAGDYLVHVLPVMALLGAGAGLAFPALMTLAMSEPPRPTPAWPPASSTRPPKSAGRSASPSWPRWRRRRARGAPGRPPRRSMLATTWPTSSPRASSWPPSPSPVVVLRSERPPRSPRKEDPRRPMRAMRVARLAPSRRGGLPPPQRRRRTGP